MSWRPGKPESENPSRVGKGTKLRGDAGEARRDPRFLELGSAALDLLHLLFGQELPRGIVGELEGVEALGFRGQLARVEAEACQALVLLLGQVELEPTPALAIKADVAALCVEQQLGLFRAKRGIRYVEHHPEIEQLDLRLRHIQPHPPGDVRQGEGGQFTLYSLMRIFGGTVLSQAANCSGNFRVTRRTNCEMPGLNLVLSSSSKAGTRSRAERS